VGGSGGGSGFGFLTKRTTLSGLHAEFFVGLDHQTFEGVEAGGFAGVELVFGVEGEGDEDLFRIREAGDFKVVELQADGAFGLQFAEFCHGAAEEVVRLGAGDGGLFPGREIGGGVLFENAAAAETPGGGHDFGNEGFFENAFRGELGEKGDQGLGVFFGFGVEDGFGGGSGGAVEAVCGWVHCFPFDTLRCGASCGLSASGYMWVIKVCDADCARFMKTRGRKKLSPGDPLHGHVRTAEFFGDTGAIFRRIRCKHCSLVERNKDQALLKNIAEPQKNAPLKVTVVDHAGTASLRARLPKNWHPND
jgi:hypothetical protein